MSQRNNASRDLSIRLPGLARRWRSGEFDAAEFATQYFLHWQIASYGREFASRRHRRDSKPDVEEWLTVLDTTVDGNRRERLLDWLERYQFRCVLDSVPVALVQWLRGAWPLVAREDIPAALEVLRMQARGCRPVTMITAWPLARERMLTKPNAFAFFLHDLEHAYKFCHSPRLYAGQCDFLARLEAAIDRGVFAPYIDDAGFLTRFHYLMSDMNTHPEHSRQYLRAVLIEFYGRREQRAPNEWLSQPAERAIHEVMAAVHVPAMRRAAKLASARLCEEELAERRVTD